MSRILLLTSLTLGVAARIWLATSPLAPWLSDRPELVTPVTSWKRLTEGLALQRAGVSPYTGDIYHEMPLTLRLLGWANELFGARIHLLFVLLDVILVLVLDRVVCLTAKLQGRQEEKDLALAHQLSSGKGSSGETAEDGKPDEKTKPEKQSKAASGGYMASPGRVRLTRLYVVAAYMLNPLGVASCAARSTAVLSNLAAMLAIWLALRGTRLGAAFCVALAAYQSVYHAVLIVPVSLLLVGIERQESEAGRPITPPPGSFQGKPKPKSNKDSKTTIDAKNTTKSSLMTGAGGSFVGEYSPNSLAAVSIIQTTICAGSALALLLYASHTVEGNSWEFLRSTVWFVFSVPDLSPNIGVFWYFFTEMFDHFRAFFLCVFQIHAFIYVVPLTFRLRQHPMFLAYMLLALAAIFKSYPSYADGVLYMSLLPVWRAETAYMRNNLVVAAMYAVAVALAPVLWHLWIETGTANANFYFAITLVMCTAQIFLVTDLLFAFLRRRYDAETGGAAAGGKELGPDRKPAAIILD